MAEGIEISVFAPSDLTTPLGIVARRWEPTLLEEHNRDGGGGFKIRIDDQAIEDEPDLLDEGNLVQIKVDAVLRQTFEIKRKTIKIVPEGEYAGEWLEVSGSGPMEWFNHANVLPERGISQITDDRIFNFTSAAGAWYNAADWTNAVSGGQIHAATHINDTFPREWPIGLHADWIWSQNSANAPVGDVFFRREFSTTVYANYRLIGTADDFMAVYIDGVRVMAVTEVEGAMNTYSEDLELEAGNHVLAIKGRTTGGPAGVVLALCKVADQQATEDIKDSHRTIWTGDQLSLWKVRAYPAIDPGWTLGQILIALVDEARARGVNSMQRISLGFTATHDSDNIPWGKSYDFSCEVGDTYRQIIERFTDSYADIWITPGLTMKVTQQRGVDRSVSVAGKDPVMFRRGLNVLSAETEVTAEIANVAFIKTNNGMLESPGPAASISKYGRRESYLSATNSASSEMTDALVKQLFDKFSEPRLTPTLEITDGDGYQPWQDFGVGDWILAPSDTDPLKLVKRRVMSIAVSEDSETGRPIYVCEIDSIQESYEERVNRWLQSIENSGKSGGVSGTSSKGGAAGDLPAPGSGQSSPIVPFVRDTRIPTAPTGVSVTPDIVTEARNTPTGKLSVFWAHSLKATDGTDVQLEGFEVWIRENVGSAKYYILGTVIDIDRELYAEGLRIKSLTGTAMQYQVVVRAKSLSGKMSDFSQPVVVTMIDDTTAPLKPSTPTVTVDRTAFKIVTNGKDLNGAAAAADYEYTIVETAATSGAATWTEVAKVYGAGEAWSGGYGYTTRFFRVKHVDRSGNISVPSTAASATAVPLVDADIVLSVLDGATTQIKNVGSDAIMTGAILSTKLADNAVTLAKLADQAVSLAKMDTSANTKIQQGINDALAAQGTANAANSAAGTAQSAADAAQAKVDALASSGTNLAINGDLELPIAAGSTAATNWSTRQLAYCEVDARAHSGAQLLRLAPTTALISYHYSGHIAAAPNRTFAFEYWARLGAALVTNDATALLQFAINITRYDGTTTTSVVDADNFVLSSLTTTGWTRLSGSYTLSPTSNAKSIRVTPRAAGNGNTYLIDDLRVVDMTEAKAALDAAALAQSKADDAFADAQDALRDAGLAQDSADGKTSSYYGGTAPAGSGFTINDTWYKSPGNQVHRWDGDSWNSIADTSIATAQAAANAADAKAVTADGKAVAAQNKANSATSEAAAALSAANAADAKAVTADGKAVAAQNKANSATSEAAAALSAGNAAATTAEGMANVSTSPAPATLAVAGGAIWQQIDANNTDRIIGTWVAGNDKVWKPRLLQDVVLGNINALKITTGTMSAARVNAAEMRAAILLVGKITASDIVASTLTSASGVFGTMDASVINAGEFNAARLNASDVRAKFLAAGKIVAEDMVASTLTSASGVFGTMDASVINAGEFNAARLNAGDVRAKFLAAGKITAADMVANTITAASGVIGSLDIGKVTTGSMSGIYITAGTIKTKHLTVSDLTNFAPPLTQTVASGVTDAGDWSLTGQMAVVSSSLDTSGFRFSCIDATVGSRAYGPTMSVKPGETLWGGATLYRDSGSVAAYLRYEFMDENRVGLQGAGSINYLDFGQSATSGGTGSRWEGSVTVPPNAAFARWYIIISAGTGSTGFYNIEGRRQTSSVYIADGAVTAQKVVANAIQARHILVGDFANLAIGSDFEDAAAVPWALSSLHTITTAQKKYGTQGLRLAAVASAGTPASSLFTNETKVREGEQWNFKMHAYIDAAFNGGSNSKLRIQSGATVLHIPFNTITRSVWTATPLEGTITIPAGATSMTVELYNDNTLGTAYVDDIQIRRMSEASLISNLGVEKLTASTANMSTAVIDKLWTDVVRSRKITTDLLQVGRGDNMIPWMMKDAVPSYDPHVKTGTGTVLTIETDTAYSGKSSLSITGLAVTSGTFTAGLFFRSGITANNGALHHFNVAAGEKMVLETKVRAGGTYVGPIPQVRFQVAFSKPDGAWNGTTYSAAQRLDFTWKTLSHEFTVPANSAGVYIYLQQDEPGMVRVDDPFMKPQLQASLIATGGIVSTHITASEAMWTKVLGAHKINAVEIDVNNLGADTGFVGVLRANILTADLIKATHIDTDAITSKHTITGATIQTDAANSRGIKLEGGYFRAWTDTGVETFAISGITGNVVGTGTWRTGTSGNYINMTGDSNGGIVRFYTGSGSGRGSIWARNDVTDGPKMSIAYSDLDEPSGMLPVIVAMPAKVYMRYGSRALNVGLIGGVETLEIDCSGAAAVMRGNFDMREGGSRTQYRYQTATTLGYIGQRPESGTSADFEIRAEVGGVRITGALTNFQTYNLTTTGSANINVDSSGNFKRSTSASRYKADQKVLEISPSALDVKVKDWIDKGELERAETQEEKDALRRYPGLIAEDLEAAGQEQFVIYGDDGQTEGVMYERFAFAQIAALNAKLDMALDEIARLKGN